MPSRLPGTITTWCEVRDAGFLSGIFADRNSFRLTCPRAFCKLGPLFSLNTKMPHVRRGATGEVRVLDLKQPMLGIAATAIIMALSLAFISLFDFPTFAGWVSYALMSIIPMEIVVGITWSAKQPAFAAAQPQPLRGLLLVIVTALVGAVAGAAYFTLVGGSVGPPTPMLMHATIVVVVVTFWFAVMWGGWPFNLLRSPIAAGLSMLVACYVVNYILFRLFFDYAFMQDAPVYVATLDPGGMFNAVSALVFYVTAVGVMFLTLNFDLWPFTSSKALMQQPVLGVVWTIKCLAIAAVAYWIGVVQMGMDPMRFMVTAPIPFIFGTIVVLNMLQGSMFAGMTQPLRGVLNGLASAVIGTLLALLYGGLAAMVTGSLNAGPPTYDFEIWLASALLGVTFPFLIFKAEFFGFWPLKKATD
jgi:hypothetical protein